MTFLKISYFSQFVIKLLYIYYFFQFTIDKNLFFGLEKGVG